MSARQTEFLLLLMDACFWKRSAKKMITKQHEEVYRERSKVLISRVFFSSFTQLRSKQVWNLRSNCFDICSLCLLIIQSVCTVYLVPFSAKRYTYQCCNIGLSTVFEEAVWVFKSSIDAATIVIEACFWLSSQLNFQDINQCLQLWF